MSVALYPLALQSVENLIKVTERDVSDLKERAQRLWTNHTLATQLEASANTIASLTTLTNVDDLVAQLNSGNLSSYDQMLQILNEQRLLSARFLNDSHAEISSCEERLRELVGAARTVG